MLTRPSEVSRNSWDHRNHIGSLCLSVSSTKVKIKSDPVSCCLSVVISFIVAIVLLSITLDVSEISEVGKDVVISVITAWDGGLLLL